MKINDVLKKTASVLFLLFAAIISNAQSKNDTIYFNDSWLKTIKDSAAYFRIVEQVNDRFKVEDRFLNGKLQMSGIYTSMKPEVKEGLFKYYSKDGEPTVEGYFKANEKDGEWKTYHSKDHVWLIENFSKGKYNGEFRSYFLNGQLKRRDLYKDDKLYKKGRCYT